MKNKRYFPMFIDLSDKSVVIVGGGSTAVRRTRTLLQFTRNVTVIAKDASQELIDMEKLEYMSSAGLRLLLDAAQTIEDHGTMKVIHISPVIMNILRVTGFADLFTIE